MTVQKDLKRLIRHRMDKTGESYTTARMHLLGKKPIPKNYLELTGMSDEAVAAKTELTWPQWVAALDRVGAAGMPHKEIAAHVDGNWPIGGWWAQSVTVGYERIRGLREVGQRRPGKGKGAGTYEASKSKTFPVPIGKLYKAFSTKRLRDRWLPDVALTIRKANVDKSMRISWPDGTSLHVYFWDKGAAKSQISIQHVELKRKGDIDKSKAYWSERLAALGELLQA